MSNSNKPGPGQNLNITIKPEVSAGTYSNLAIISHTPSEFYLDFAQLAPGNHDGTAVVNSRIIMSPMHTKRLLAALADNLRKYEARYGEVEMLGDEQEESRRMGAIPFDLSPKGKA